MGGGCSRGAHYATLEPESDKLQTSTASAPRRSSRRGSYFKREDVKQLLQRLEEDQPDDLQAWLIEYTSDPSVGSEIASMCSTPKVARSRRHSESWDPEEVRRSSVDDLHGMIDWRYFIFNAEKDIHEASRSHSVPPIARKCYKGSATDMVSFLPRMVANLLPRRNPSGRASTTSDAEDMVCRHASITSSVNNADGKEILYTSDSEEVKWKSEGVLERDQWKSEGGFARQISGGRCVTPAVGHGSNNPILASFGAAVVFADASGFTAFTEKFAAQPNGAEQIGMCLNLFFEPLIRTVTKFSGDIVKFSGDALTIVWPADDTNTWPTESSASVAALACCACREMQDKVVDCGQTTVPGISLSLHIGIGLGHLNLLQFGGLMGRWEFCVAGVPLQEACHAEPLAKSGEIVVSPSLQDALRSTGWLNCFEFEDVNPEGTSRYSRLLSAQGPTPLPDINVLRSSLAIGLVDRSRQVGDAQQMARFIPQAILRNIVNACHLEAEMRHISVIFLSISGLDPGKGKKEAGRVQAIMRLLQRSCYALEGSVNKFLVDDKGMVFLACYGLPPLNHYTDDPLRAVLAAARFIDTLREENLQGKAGVATGKVWCGVMGSEIRREYTVLGDTVNLSARLMSSAKPNAVMVDYRTQASCGKTLEFASLGSISLKGKEHQEAVFQFTGKLAAVEHLSEMATPALMTWGHWKGRLEVIAALEAQLSHKSGPRGIVFVQGGQGCGKTEANSFVGKWAASKKFALLAGQNMSPACTFAVSRLCWQEVFRTLVHAASNNPYWQQRVDEHVAGATSGHTGAPRPSQFGFMASSSSHLYQLLITMLTAAGADDDLLSWAPLLNVVLPRLEFGPKVVQAMLERDEQHAGSREPRLAQLCAKLIEAFASFGNELEGTIVLLHMKGNTSFFQPQDRLDGHIATAVAQLCRVNDQGTDGKPRPLILAVIGSQLTSHEVELAKEAAVLNGLVNVRDLNREETRKYMAHVFGAPDVDACLVDHVYEVCGGNPHGIDILCEQLERLAICQHLHGKKVQPTRDWQDPARLQEVEHPEVLVGRALSTFEKLEPQDQELIKTAACVSEATGTFGPFTTVDLQRGLEDSSEADICARCLRLVEMGILKNGETENTESKAFGFGRLSVAKKSPGTSGHSFRFGSRVLRHVASMLVLQVRRDDVNNEDFGQRATDHHVPYNPTSSTELDVVSAALLGIGNDDDSDY